MKKYTKVTKNKIDMKKVLFIIDAQNDFCSPNGSLSTKDAEEVVAKIPRFVQENNFDVICVTMDYHDKNYLSTHEGKCLPVEHCIANTWGCDLNSSIDGCLKALPYKDLVLISKDTFGISASSMNNLVKKLEGEEVEFHLVGFCTDICVITNALSLRTNFPESNIVVHEEYCAGTTKEKHEQALSIMESCQIKIEEN